jgi:hypothetical protein
MQVFISYNHHDRAFAVRLRDALKNAGVGVTIDIDALQFGDNLQQFAENAVRAADLTVFIVSEHSLRSVWVIEEFLLTRMHEHARQTQKLLPVAIDHAFFGDDFYLQLVDEIDVKLRQKDSRINRLRERFAGTRHLDRERGRLLKQRQSLDAVLERLHSVRVADFSTDDTFQTNLPALIQKLQEHAAAGDRQPAALHLGYLHNFDLGKITRLCMEAVYTAPQRLIGCAVCCSCDTLLDNLCKRLEARWDGDVAVQKRIPTNPLHTPLSEALAILHKRCDHDLDNRDAIIVVQAGAATVRDLWRQLAADYQDGLSHRLFVLFGVEADDHLPDALVPLDPPQFRIGDAIDWIQSILAAQRWPRDVMTPWVQHIQAECGGLYEHDAALLCIELLYDHLERAIHLLQQDLSHEQFLQALIEED